MFYVLKRSLWEDFMEYIIAIIAVLQGALCFRLLGPDRNRVVYLLYLEIIYNLFVKFLVGFAGLPSLLNYVSDAILLWILAEFVLQHRRAPRKIPKSMLLFGGILLGLTVLSYALNRYSPLLYLWGLRNNFRFVLFAMMCAVYLEKEDMKHLSDILFGFLITNILVMTWQYFCVPCDKWSPGDFISGLYSNGPFRGGNESISWLVCIVCTLEAVRYLQKDGCKPWRMLLSWGGSAYLAGLAEIKLIFPQLLMIAVLAVLLCKKSRRSLWLLLTGGISVFLGIQLLYQLYPAFDDFFNPDTMNDYVTRDDLYPGIPDATEVPVTPGTPAEPSEPVTGPGLNRMTAIPYMLEHFLLTWPRKLFGIGLGNGDFSGFSWLTSDFYRQYHSIRYTYFSSSMVVLELGLVGLAAYCLWFFNFLRRAFFLRPADETDRIIRPAVVILALMVYVMILCNQTMKLETSAYLVGFVLSFPFLTEGMKK